jgi:hypothetical protein
LISLFMAPLLIQLLLWNHVLPMVYCTDESGLFLPWLLQIMRFCSKGDKEVNGSLGYSGFCWCKLCYLSVQLLALPSTGTVMEPGGALCASSAKQVAFSTTCQKTPSSDISVSSFLQHWKFHPWFSRYPTEFQTLIKFTSWHHWREWTGKHRCALCYHC